MHEIFDAPEWLAALTLAERAALALPGSEDLLSPEDRARANKKAQRWQAETRLDDALFASRLAVEGLAPERFLRILAEPADRLGLPAAGRPGWLEPLVRAFSRPAPPLPEPYAAAGALGILEVLRPLIAGAQERLLAGLGQLAAPARIDPRAVAGGLLPALLKRLRLASERALILELHASGHEGKLHGETPEERYASFVAMLRDPGVALTILQRYPALARDACRHAEQWIAAGLEMAERFAADREEIVQRFAAGEDPGALTAAGAGLGDSHAGGRSVAILAFASGLRIVYKPKPQAIDLRFQELVGWLNAKGASPPLRRLAVLDRGAYGWMEHAAALPCRDPGELERFHERQGAWVALLYTLEATDFHHENLIASGEHPVPIDLETLLQPLQRGPAAGGTGQGFLAQTVLRSHLLPRRFQGKAELDLSGMGAVAGQPLEVKAVTDEGTDRMRWASRWTEWEAGPNLPTLNGEPVALWEHGEAVLRGFQSMLRLLRQNRGELLAAEGPLAPFAGLPIRTLLRATTAYIHLLHAAHHPDFLHNALDRDRLFDRLWHGTLHDPRLRRAVQAEREDLLAGDVPRFESLPSSTDLLHPRDGRAERIEGFFARSGLERARTRLRDLDDDDFERQSWLVRASLEATRPLSERSTRVREPLPEFAGPAAPERFLAAARRLGGRLAQRAIEQEGAVSWFGLEVTNDGWHLGPMGIGLYNGLPGMALFFAHLGRLTGDNRAERLARLAAKTVRGRIAAEAALLRIGAFSGWGGLVYVLTHLGLLWEEPELLDEAESLALRMASGPGAGNENGIESDRVFDLIAGAAGCAAAVLALHRRRPSPALLEIAVRCGGHLLAHAIRDERGTSWPHLPGVSDVPLTGFAHGTAGISWVLAALTKASGEERFREAARGALRYERSWFCAERGSWPDLRESRKTDGGRPFFHAWCHGAPGIGLGRIASLPDLDDPEMLGEIRAALRSTLEEGFGFNDCLCHGDLGNLELVREAGRALGDPGLAAEAERLAGCILTRIEREGPRCGTSSSVEMPGLMTGLAGIGYGLLRAAAPDLVPCVLLLETPR